MCRLVQLVALICCFGLFSFGQHGKEKFHWDWHNIQKDGWESIGQAKFLTPNERALLTAAIAAQFQSEEHLGKSSSQAYVKAVNLGDDGGREFLTLSSFDFCSPTGNCEAWIFRLRNDKYSVILHRPATQAFTIQSTVSHGFHDIVLIQHGSATSQGLTLYRFDSSKYRRVSCYDARWDFLGKDGEQHTRKEPLLTPAICGFR